MMSGRRCKGVAISALLVLAALLPQPAGSCTCVDSGDIKKRIKRYPLIFLGQVVDQVTPKADITQVTFRVSRVWKGEHRTEAIVRASVNPEACGYSFARGSYYVVFAYAQPPGWGTSRCTPTESASRAEGVIRALDAHFHVTTAIPADGEGS